MTRDSSFDRREYLRVLLETVLGGAEIWESDAAPLDVSAAGIRFRCAGLGVRVGDRLRVELTLENQAFHVIGTAIRVIRVDESLQEVAMAFSEIDLDLERLLEEALEADHREELELAAQLSVYLVRRSGTGS